MKRDKILMNTRICDLTVNTGKISLLCYNYRLYIKLKDNYNYLNILAILLD